MTRKLTTKQLKFIEAYDGNGADAARKAGYAGDNHALSVVAGHLLANDSIRQLIKERQKPIIQAITWNREKLQEFWISIASDEKVDLKHRLKASELLGRSQAIFTDNLNLKNNKPTSVTFVEADEEAIEAEVISRSEST